MSANLSPTVSVYGVQARTDAAGAAVVDVNGEELRLVAQMLTAGIFQANDYKVAPGAGLSVDVGSGSAKSDLAVVDGVVAGQGKYLVRLDVGTVNVPLNAADLTNPRIDAIYLTVADNQYNSGGISRPFIAYLNGTPAASPVAPAAPGPNIAFLKLAEVLVPAGATSVTVGNITDARSLAGLRVNPATTIPAALLPAATLAAAGIVQLSSAVNSTAENRAATPAAVKLAYDAAVAAQAVADEHFHDAADVNSGVFLAARIPDLDAAKIVTGVLSVSRIPTGTSSTTVALGNHNHDSVYYTETEMNSLLDQHHGFYHASYATTPKRIFVQAGTPSGGTTGELWIDT